jgi:uncharacterized protein (DUF1499 family)
MARLFFMGAILFLLLPAVFITGVLVLNRLPWSEPPGFTARLKLYLTHGIADTHDYWVYPELRPHTYLLSAGVLEQRVKAAAASVGCMPRMGGPGHGSLQFECTTPLLHFKDDITVTVEPVSTGSLVHLRSAARVGWGDLGANTRHVLDFYDALDRMTALEFKNPSSPGGAE